MGRARRLPRARARPPGPQPAAARRLPAPPGRRGPGCRAAPADRAAARSGSIARARAQGALRADFTLGDLSFALWSFAPLLRGDGGRRAGRLAAPPPDPPRRDARRRRRRRSDVRPLGDRRLEAAIDALRSSYHRRRARVTAAAAHPRHLRRAPARPAARVARPDDRLDRAADDRRRPRRDRAPLVGRDRVPARVDGRRAAVREARRPLRAQARPPDRDRDLPRRLGALRPEPEHGRADRLPRAPGARRRRADRDDDGGRRRPRPAARARPLPGLLRRRLRRLDGDRAAARRLLRRQPLVALDLLRQPADRRSSRSP